MSHPLGTCQRCGRTIHIGPGAQPNVGCTCGAPAPLVLGDQRLFISLDAQFPVDWDKVEFLLRDGQTLYWKRFTPATKDAEQPVSLKNCLVRFLQRVFGLA